MPVLLELVTPGAEMRRHRFSHLVRLKRVPLDIAQAMQIQGVDIIIIITSDHRLHRHRCPWCHRYHRLHRHWCPWRHRCPWCHRSSTTCQSRKLLTHAALFARDRPGLVRQHADREEVEDRPARQRAPAIRRRLPVVADGLVAALSRGVFGVRGGVAALSRGVCGVRGRAGDEAYNNLLCSLIFAVSIAIIVTTLKIANVNTMIFAIFTVVITTSQWASRSSLRSVVLLPPTRPQSG